MKVPEESIQTRPQSSVGFVLLFALTGILLALGHGLGRAFISNQNQYFVPVVAQRAPSLRSDWFANTPDPYPFFSWIAGVTLDRGGVDGLRIAAFISALIAIWGVGMISAAINPTHYRSVPIISMIGVGTLLNPHMDGVLALLLGSTYPIPLVGDFAEWLATPIANPFHGLAGQYSVSTVGYLQPSSAGVLLLPALALFLFRRLNRSVRNRTSRWLFTAATMLAMLAAAIHPTYMVAAALGIGIAGLLDAHLCRSVRVLLAYMLAAALIVLASFVTNPALFDIAASGPGESEALSRFAFENIPFHTLWFEWPTHDVMRIAVIVAGALLAIRTRGGWFLGVWLIATLSVGLLSALIVGWTYWTTLALLFPWRISVVLLPVAWTILATVFVAFIRRKLPDQLSLPWIFSGVAIVVIGLSVIALRVQIENAQRPAPVAYDSMTRAVIAANPSGIGFTPPGSTYVRLNAEVPIYVDDKSPPYAGADLIEWWDRIDRTYAIARDPELVCTSGVLDQVDWVLWRSSWTTPDCLLTWTLASEDEGFIVLIKE